MPNLSKKTKTDPATHGLSELILINNFWVLKIEVPEIIVIIFQVISNSPMSPLPLKRCEILVH